MRVGLEVRGGVGGKGGGGSKVGMESGEWGMGEVGLEVEGGGSLHPPLRICVEVCEGVAKVCGDLRSFGFGI